MNIDDLYNKLQKFNINPSNKDIAYLWGMDVASFSRKKKSGTPIKQKNIAQVEDYYNVKLTRTNVYTLERQNDTTIPQKVERFGYRLTELQDKHEYLDKDMAKLLRISEEDYIDLKLGDAEPDFNVLVRLKQCFKVSIDWLLFGD